jgi:hypothetical protein
LTFQESDRDDRFLVWRGDDRIGWIEDADGLFIGFLDEPYAIVARSSTLEQCTVAVYRAWCRFNNFGLDFLEPEDTE